MGIHVGTSAPADLMLLVNEIGFARAETDAPKPKAHGNRPFLAWYLAGMKSASTRAGKRLVALIPRVRAWVAQENPRTKLSIGEY
jgi:Glycoside hydrolase family 44